METSPPLGLSVCFEVRKPDRFNSRFALMLHFFPCNIITLALDTNIGPLSQTFFPLHCNYHMHACAEGTYLLLFVSLPWWWWWSEQPPL